MTSLEFDGRKLEKFKDVYSEQGRYNLEAQVPYLSDLADYYGSRFRSTRDWIDAVKAHVLYNSCAVRDGNEIWSRKAYDVQLQYWNGAGELSFQEQRQLTNRFKRKLENYARLQVNGSLLDLDETFHERSVYTYDDCDRLSKALCVMMPEAMRHSNSAIIKLVKDIIDQAVKIHSCDDLHRQKLQNFCAVGLGTLAQGEVTSYSSVEFMFLISDDGKQNEDLFEMLAVTCYFLITNIGETTLDNFDIDELSVDEWFSDEAKSGFQIHGLRKKTGHIPTSELYSSKPNFLITTVKDLVQQYREAVKEFDDFSNPKSILVDLLSSLVFINGDRTVFDGMHQVMSQVSFYGMSSLVVMRMREHVDAFSGRPESSELEMSDFISKVSLYLRSILVDLKMLFNITANKAPDIISDLYAEKKISESLSKSLRIAYYSTQYITYASHKHHKSQCSSLIIQTKQVMQSADWLPWVMPKSLLTLLLMHFIPVESQIHDCLRNLSALSEERKPSFTEALCIAKYHSADYSGFLQLADTALHAGIQGLAEKLSEMRITSLTECNRFQDAEKELELLASKQGVDTKSQTRYHQLCYGYDMKISNFNAALEHSKQALVLMQDFLQVTASSNLANAYNNIGLAYENLGQYKYALENYEKAVAAHQFICKDLYHIEIASSYDKVGSVHQKLGDYRKALEHYKKALDIRINIFGEVDHPAIASSYSHIGSLCNKQARYGEALEKYSKALSIQLKLYGDEDHQEIAESLNNIGLVYSYQGDYEKAFNYYHQALIMRLKIYGTYDHPEIAVSYNNIGSVYFTHGDYDAALKSFDSALTTQLLVYGLMDHPDKAMSHNNIGLAYQNLGKYEEALKNYREAVFIQNIVFGDIDHPLIAISRSNIGSVYARQGDYEHALHNYQTALSMQKTIYGDDNHPDIAVSYDKIAGAYANEGNYDKAVEYCEKSISIRQKIYGDVTHPDLALSYLSLGSVYESKHEFTYALENYNKAVSIQQRLYGSDCHPAIARSYDYIGSLYDGEGKYDTALDFYEKALSIRRRIYHESNHPDIARSYFNFAMVYENQGNNAASLKYYEKAQSMRESHTDIDQSGKFATPEITSEPTGYTEPVFESSSSEDEDFEEKVKRLAKSDMLPETNLGDVKFHDLQSAFERKVLDKINIPNLCAIFGPVDIGTVSVFGENVESDHELERALEELVAQFHGVFHYKRYNTSDVLTMEDYMGAPHVKKKVNDSSDMTPIGKLCAICSGRNLHTGETCYFVITAGHVMIGETNHNIAVYNDDHKEFISKKVTHVESEIGRGIWCIDCPKISGAGIPLLINENGRTCLLQVRNAIHKEVTPEPYQHFSSDIALLHMKASKKISEEPCASGQVLLDLDHVQKADNLIAERTEVYCHHRTPEVTGVVVPGVMRNSKKYTFCHYLTFVANRDSFTNGDSGAAIKVKHPHSREYEVVAIFTGSWSEGAQRILAHAYGSQINLEDKVFYRATYVHPSLKQIEKEFEKVYQVGSLSLIFGSEEFCSAHEDLIVRSVNSTSP